MNILNILQVHAGTIIVIKHPYNLLIKISEEQLVPLLQSEVPSTTSSPILKKIGGY